VLVSQICSFPESERDDLTDTTTQVLRLLKDMDFLRIDPAEVAPDYYDDERPRRVNPYAQ